MRLPIARIVAALACLFAAFPAATQSGPDNAAEEALSTLRMQVAAAGREFRAIAPFRGNEFLAASFDLEGETTTAALHVISADGQIGSTIPLRKPSNYAGSRIDRLIPVGDALIGIGHLAGGPDDRRGWVIRIERDLSISAQSVLPLAVENQPINYYYGGVLDERGRLVVAGRGDQPDFPGIGVRFNWHSRNLLQISMAYPGGSARDAGIVAGDIILRANGRDLAAMDPQQMIAQLAGSIDEPLQITVDRPGVGQFDVTMPRKMVTGVTTGVLAVLDPSTLDVIEAPKPIVHATSRAGFQDIGQTRDGRLVAVGWWEVIAPDGSTFDKAWTVALNSSLNPWSDTQFGRDGESSIAQRVHAGPDGRFVVIGGMNAAPEPLAFASELILESGPTNTARLDPIREHHLGPGRADVFRGIATLGNGSTIVAGAFRSDENPRYQAAAMVLTGGSRPRWLFGGCVQSYVWDMASNLSNSLAIAGYCIGEDGERRAALMWSPPMRLEPTGVALDHAPRLRLQPTGQGQSFDLAQSESVLIYVPAGTPGVLSLSDASGQLVDFATVDSRHGGLLEADLDPGQYIVNWASDGAGAAPKIDVVKADLAAPEPGFAGQYELAPEMAKALSLLGYDAAEQDQDTPHGAQSMAMTRDIAAYQLSRNLPAVGHLDDVTEVTLAVEAGLRAEATGEDTAALAERLSRSPDAKTLTSRFGPVRGQWRGDMFLGYASAEGRAYAGEWQLTDAGEVVPAGFGRLEDRNSQDIFAGMFGNGVLSGLGVAKTYPGNEVRYVGTYDPRGRFTKGAVFRAGQLASSGVFAPGGQSLLQDVPLPR